tara:strand:+ start:925 stop:1734 length:810 start_codon:yes stop_codon:yes gene_type:complete
MNGNQLDVAQNFLGNSNLNIKKLCDRNFGVGADGLIIAEPSTNGADIKMRIFNSDGSEPEMCGNGIRCFIKYILTNSIVKKKKFINVQTLAGNILAMNDNNSKVKVNMGKPMLEPEDIPTTLTLGNNGIPEGNILISNKNIRVYAIGMGNPHMITYVKDFNDLPLNEFGSLLENNKYSPSKTNVHFVKVINKSKIEVMVWERGAGPTLACGTGACACLVVSKLLNKTSHNVEVLLPGGTLEIEWDNDNVIYMTGEAKYVFTGEIEINNL